MNDAITSVYIVIAVWIPVTVVPTSLATVAIDTFMTELSSVMTNWPEASVNRTSPLAFARTCASAVAVSLSTILLFLRRFDASAPERIDTAPPARYVEQLDPADIAREAGVDDQVVADRLEPEHGAQEEQRCAG